VEFLSEKISLELFEVGSEQRLNIILHLNEKRWSISALAKELDSTVTEVHRNFGRLQKAGLILKNTDGTFHLTIRGENICSQIPSIAFVLENTKYFENHTFGDLPNKFRQRIGDLYEHKHIKGVVRVLEKWKQVHNNSNQYIYNVLTEVPYSKEIIDVVEEKLSKKIKIHSVFAENAIIPEERKKIFKTKNFNKFIKDDLLVRKMIKQVSIVVLLNEKEACVIFPNQTGEPDMSEMFYSTDHQFHEWCLDYFEHCWKNSSSFHESKLNAD
jgi:predicted transcriptional regulator